MLSANVSRKMFSISPPRNLDTFRSARTFPSSKREQSLRFIGCMRERESNSLARFLRPRPPCVINSVASYVIDSLHGNTLSSRSSRPRRDDDSRGAKVDNAEIEFNSTYVRRNYLKTTSNCQINWKYVAAGDFTRGRGRARRGCALFMGLSITNLPRENNAKTSAPRRLTGNLLRSGENDNFPGKRRNVLFFFSIFSSLSISSSSRCTRLWTVFCRRRRRGNSGMEERFHGNRGFLRNGGIRGFARNT